VTVTNLSQSTVSINAGTAQDFVIDPSCGPLLPGGSCDLTVRYLPTSGVPQGSGGLTIQAFDLATVTTVPPYPPPIGSVVVPVTGFATQDASLASPSYPPLIQPVNADLSAGSIEISNNSTTLVLSSIVGYATVADATGCSPSIPPGGSCTVGLSLGCPYGWTCQFGVYSNALSSPDMYGFNQQSSGGIGYNPISFSPGSPLVFPQTTLGASTTATLNLRVVEYGGILAVSISAVPNVSNDFTIDNQCPTVLNLLLDHSPPQWWNTCNVVLTFAPKTLGFHSGTITFNTSLGLWTFVIAGTAVTPPLSVTPTNLVFSGPTGQPVTNTVTLTNLATTALTLSPPTLTGPQASYFQISQTTCASTLAAGEACTVQLTYSNPVAQALSLAQLVFTSGINNVVQNVNLVGVIPQLIVTPGAGTFAPTSIGNQTHSLFTLTTYRGAPITIQSVAITGANASDFKIASSSCTAGLVLQETMSCVVDVAFTPLAIGTMTASLSIASSAGASNIDLVGTGALAPAQVSPTALVFGNQGLMIPGVAQLIALANPNPQALTLPALPALSGANPSDFTITGDCTTIPANSACTLGVIFTPSATGTRTASLTIGTGTTFNPSNGLPVSTSTTVTFTGVGVVTGPPATVHPLGLHFHKRLVGSTSEPRKIFLTNPGTATLMLPAPPTITGADPLDFQLRGACASIPSGSFCELGVQFTPTAEGNRSATLSIPTGGSTNTSVSVSLEGIGCVRDRREESHDRDDSDCREKERWHEHDRDDPREDQRN
jgi:hypothetical protein